MGTGGSEAAKIPDRMQHRVTHYQYSLPDVRRKKFFLYCSVKGRTMPAE
jgi:hypothetical protein